MTIEPVIRHISEADEYYFREGCFILEYHNCEHDSEVSIARARVNPGQRTRVHRLREISERYLVLSGEGVVHVADHQEKVVSGSLVMIPPGVAQSIENTGETDLVFLAICSPRFSLDAYEEVV